MFSNFVGRNNCFKVKNKKSKILLFYCQAESNEREKLLSIAPKLGASVTYAHVKIDKRKRQGGNKVMKKIDKLQLERKKET